MKHYTMKFKVNEALLNDMLQLRRKGWTYVSLAFIFGVDHSSIYKWCKIRHLPKPDTTISIDVSSLISRFGYKTRHLKTYQEYLMESRKRKVKTHA